MNNETAPKGLLAELRSSIEHRENPKSAELLVKFPVNRKELNDNSTRTVEINTPPTFDAETFGDVLETIKKADIKTPPTVEIPTEPTKWLKYQVREFAAIKAGAALTMREKYATEDEVNTAAALRVQTETLNSFPKPNEKSSLIALEAALEIMDRTLEQTGLAWEKRAVIHQQAEAIIVKAFADRISLGIDQSPEIHNIAINEQKPKSDAVRELNAEFTWPTDQLGRNILKMAEELPKGKTEEEVLQEELAHMSGLLLGAVVEYNRNPNKVVATQTRPRATQMARVMLNLNNLGNFSETTRGAIELGDNLLAKEAGDTAEPPFEFSKTKGVVRKTRLEGLGPTAREIPDGDIASIDTDTFRHNLENGFQVASISREEVTGEPQFWKNYKKEVDEGIKSGKVQRTVSRLGGMAAHFNANHTQEENLDTYGKALGAVSNEDVLRLSIAVLGREFAEQADTRFRFATKTSVNRLPDDRFDVEKDERYQFAYSVQMLARATRELDTKTAEAAAETDAHKQKELQQMLPSYEQEMGYAFLLAIHNMKTCDKLGFTTIPRIKGEDEVWDQDTTKLPQKKAKQKGGLF